MKLLTELDSLDNVKDGETRKLITKTASSGSGNVVSSVSVSGDTITYTKGVSALTAHQNAFSKVKVGSTEVTADSAGDTLELAAGSNITLTPDATNDKVTIAASQPTKVSQLTNDSGYITNTGSTSGNAGTATKLQTARTIAIGTGVTGTATSFDGSNNITIPVTGMKEAYNVWGGKNISGSVTPNDMGCIDEFGHNKLAFLDPACLEIKYSTDGGTTWIDSGLTDAQKIAMMTTSGPTAYIGGATAATADNIANLKLRIRLACGTVGGSLKIYTAAKKLLFNVNTQGAASYVDMRYRTIANYMSDTDSWTNVTSHYALSGGSGWNSIPFEYTFGGSMTTQTGQIGQFEFVFGCSSLGTWGGKKLGIIDIRLIGSTNWTMPSELARAGYLYKMDTNQNAAFPGDITPQVNNSKNLGSSSYKWANVYATTFNGNATSATTASKATGDKNGNDITTTYYLASNPNGYTSNTGTITGVSVNGTSVATSGVANITSVPASILSGAIPSAVTATTQSSGDNSTKIATTAFVSTAISALPAALNNIKDGSAIGSLRTSESISEGSSYTLGDYSFAEGYHTRAAGERSHVEGDQNYATGMGTHSEGGSNKAIGNYSHAEGRNNTANGENSHTEGSYTTTGESASNAHAEGYHSTASESAAHAEGYYTKAISSATHAEGYYTTASGSYSHAEGYYAGAVANYAHAEGYHATASGSSAHAEGYYTVARGGHTEGDSTFALFSGCHAEGVTDNTNISGTITAIDEENLKVTVSGFSSSNNLIYQLYNNNGTTFYGDQYITNAQWSSNQHVLTLSKWNSSLAVNGTFYVKFRTMSTDSGAHAEGAGTKAASRASHAEGIGTVTSSYGQHAEGTWNVAGSNYLHIAGNGTADDARSNAYTLDWDGNGVYAGKLTVGTGPSNNMDVATKKYVDALMSSGSNSNGEYFRIGDIQICTHSVSVAKTGSSNFGSGTTYYGSGSWTYPQEFTEVWTVQVTAADTASGLFAGSLGANPGTSSCSIEWMGSNLSSGSIPIKCLAIGKWK